MAEYDFQVPTSKEEMDALRQSLRTELSDDAAEAVSGGNDDPQLHNKFDPPIPWTCRFCGATIMIRQFMDGPKHMTKCPNNPYK